MIGGSVHSVEEKSICLSAEAQFSSQKAHLPKLSIPIPQLHVRRLLIVPDLLLNHTRKLLVRDFCSSVDDGFHLGLEVVNHAGGSQARTGDDGFLIIS
jgi:hypothetical protein